MNFTVYINDILGILDCFFFLSPVSAPFRAVYVSGHASRSFPAAAAWRTVTGALPHFIRFCGGVPLTPPVPGSSGTTSGCTTMSPSGFVGEPEWGRSTPGLTRHGGHCPERQGQPVLPQLGTSLAASLHRRVALFDCPVLIRCCLHPGRLNLHFSDYEGA